MLHKILRDSFIVSGVLLVNLGLSTSADAVGIALGQSNFQATNLVGSPEQGLENSALSCGESEGWLGQEVPQAEPVMLAQAVTDSVVADSQVQEKSVAPVKCAFGPAIGGAVAGFNPAALSSLGLLGLVPISDSGSSASSAPATDIPKSVGLSLAKSSLPGGNISLKIASPISTVSPVSNAASISDIDVEKVPEPMTIFGTGCALGVAALLERKRNRASKR